MPEFVSVACPYCGEVIELAVDTSAGSSSYVEDCQVCCQPMQVTVEVGADGVAVRVKTGDE